MKNEGKTKQGRLKFLSSIGSCFYYILPKYAYYEILETKKNLSIFHDMITLTLQRNVYLSV